MMKGWLSTFARFASQFDSDTLTTPTLRTSPEAGKPPSGKYLLGEGGQQTALAPPSLGRGNWRGLPASGEEREHVEPTGPRGDVPSRAS